MFKGLYSYLYLTSLLLLYFKLYNEIELEYELYIAFIPAIASFLFNFIEEILEILKKQNNNQNKKHSYFKNKDKLK